MRREIPRMDDDPHRGLGRTMRGMNETAAPAGWYDDPGNPGVARWWDGAAWTEARRPVQTPAQPMPDIADGVLTGLTAFVCYAVIAGAMLFVIVWFAAQH